MLGNKPENKWIPHKGQVMPPELKPETRVFVKTRGLDLKNAFPAGLLEWKHGTDDDTDGDILFYQVAEGGEHG